MSGMEALLKKELGTSTLKPAGRGGGGCISNGTGYMTDQGHVFVKMNDRGKGARLMFDGEYASLAALVATNTIKVPKPIKVFDNPEGGAVFVMEYIDIHSLNKYSSALGEQLARLHLHNEEMGKRQEKQASSVHCNDEQQYVSQFGFPTTTCCGFLPQDNTWNDNWVDFFIRQKLQTQLDLVDKKYHDSEARTLWSKLQLEIPRYFKDIEIKPALLHGDLWGGNVGETKTGPVIFDPASFYGHHEFELGIAAMFGGFGRDFYNAYHKVIPKAAGFKERNSLYQLFHYLNHWNHFGSGYRSSSIGIMQQLVK